MSADAAASRGPPLGIALVCGITALYGLLWGVAGFASPPGALTALGPAVAAALLLVAYGLWTRHLAAWLLAVCLYGFGTLWQWVQLSPDSLDRLGGVYVGLAVVCYLIFRQDRFFE